MDSSYHYADGMAKSHFRGDYEGAYSEDEYAGSDERFDLLNNPNTYTYHI